MKHYITEPPCAFIEAVVAGYSPVDKWTCHFARAGARYRGSPDWLDTSWCTDRGARGEQWTRGWVLWDRNECHGEMPWRTLHV